MNIGATYITDNGETRLYIRIPANSEPGRPPARNVVPLYIQQTVDGGVSIDWGDGSELETISGTGAVNTTHTYSEAGDFVIRLTPSDGCELGFGDGTSSNCVMGSTGRNGRVYCNMLQKTEIGSGVTSIGNNAFYYCYSLAFVTIPNNVTSIGEYVFDSCYSLTSLSIPNSVNSIGFSSFGSCYTLLSLTIPDNVTSIDNNAITSCYGIQYIKLPENITEISSAMIQTTYGLSSLTIPSGVISIDSYGLRNNYGMKEYHFKPTTPPTIQSSTFTGIPSDCIIYVPVGSLSAYQTATNWSSTTIKSKLQEEP